MTASGCRENVREVQGEGVCWCTRTCNALRARWAAQRRRLGETMETCTVGISAIWFGELVKGFCARSVVRRRVGKRSVACRLGWGVHGGHGDGQGGVGCWLGVSARWGWF
jgi:hypothetical protein